MRSTILTIFPDTGERHVGLRPALTAPPRPRAEAHRPAALEPTGTLPSIESVILQRLLAEVEVLQIARVPPTYVIDQSPSPRHITLIRTLWSLLWALSIVVCAFVVKYMDSQTMVPRADARQSRSIEALSATIRDQKKDFSTIIDSLQGLAEVIASNSERTATIPYVLDRLRNDLQQQIRPALVREPIELRAEAPTPAVTPAPLQLDLAPLPMGGHHHLPIQFAVAPPDVVVHHNSLGVMDYWLMPRIVSGVRNMVKVVPISQDNNGTLVHDISEVKDYIVTSSGNWLPASEPNDAK